MGGGGVCVVEVNGAYKHDRYNKKVWLNRLRVMFNV